VSLNAPAHQSQESRAQSREHAHRPYRRQNADGVKPDCIAR